MAAPCERPTITNHRRRSWLRANQHARLLKKTDIHDLLEDLVIASLHGKAHSDLDGEGMNGGSDIDDSEPNDADVNSFFGLFG